MLTECNQSSKFSPGDVDVELLLHRVGAVEEVGLDLGLEELGQVEHEGESHHGDDVLGQPKLARTRVIQGLEHDNLIT